MILRRLEGAKMLKNLEDGRQVIDLDAKRLVTVTKADGSSLYITRQRLAKMRIYSSVPIYLQMHTQIT